MKWNIHRCIISELFDSLQILLEISELVQVASGADYVAGMNSDTAQARTHPKSPCDRSFFTMSPVWLFASFSVPL